LNCGSIADRGEYQNSLRELNSEWMAANVIDSGQVRADGDTDAKVTRIDDFKLIPCSVCGTGVLKPHVVFFGGAVPASIKDKTLGMVIVDLINVCVSLCISQRPLHCVCLLVSGSEIFGQIET
jgi:NAD-dependent SIR2 family protein deacetylase